MDQPNYTQGAAKRWCEQPMIAFSFRRLRLRNDARFLSRLQIYPTNY